MRSLRFNLNSTTSRHFHCRKIVLNTEKLGVQVNELVLQKHFTKKNILLLRLLINGNLKIALQIKNMKSVDKAECVVHVGAWRIIIDKPSDGGVMVSVGCTRPETEDYGRLKYQLFDRKFMGVMWRDNSNRRGLVSKDEGYQSANEDSYKPPLEDLYF